MNNRIKELTEQATIRVNNPTVNSRGMVICDNWEEGISMSKFAQLIIEDCKDVIAKVYRNTPLELCGPLLTANEEIDKHFYGNKDEPTN